jgi:hypothetical protein
MGRPLLLTVCSPNGLRSDDAEHVKPRKEQREIAIEAWCIEGAPNPEENGLLSARYAGDASRERERDVNRATLAALSHW